MVLSAQVGAAGLRATAAAAAAGADGIMIEVHNDPAHALCDGAQSIKPDAFAGVMNDIRNIARAVGREI